MAQPTEPSRLRRYMGGVHPGAAVGGAMLGAVNAANEVNDVRTNYGQAAANEAAPGVAAGNIAGGAAFAAEPPRMLQSRVSRALGTPGMREFAKSAANTLEAAPKPPAGASVKLGGLRSTLQRGVMPTLRQAAGRTAGNLVGGTLRRTPGTMAVYGVAKGVADSFVDNNTGYADEYAKQMGMDGSATGVVGASALRTLENIGNAATGGYAARLGQGIGTALSGGTFSEGWNQTPAREAYYEKRRQAQAAAEGVRAPGAPVDIKFHDESTPPDSFYKNPAKKPETPEARAQAAAAAGQAARYAAALDPVQAVGAQDANMGRTSSLRDRASTWGLPVNDPRMDSNYAGSAAARADALRAAGAPANGGAQFAGMRGNFRDASQMGEYYNAKEDREARQKLLSDLDSQRFRLEMIAGNPGRRGRAAIDALGDNARQRAELATAGEKLSNDAVQNRYQRQNMLDNTGMEQSGAMDRTRLQEQGATQRTGMQEDGAMRRTMVDANSRYQAALAGAGMRRRGEDPQTFAEIAKGYGGDLTAASQAVLRNKAAAGEDLTDDPLATMALTNLSDEVLAGNGRMARRGIGGTTVFGAGADGPVDPNPLNYTRQERGWWDRAGSALWPWGVGPNDVLYKDSQGNERYFDQPIFSEDPVLDKQIRDRIAAGIGYKE